MPELQPMPMMRAAVACAALGLVMQPALADSQPPPQGVVNLSASASIEVPTDWISVTLSTQREGAEAVAIQSALKQALDAALQEARRAAKPGQVEIRTGNFSLSPRYTSKGQTNGWQGRTELIIEGRDMATVAQLIGRISTLSIARVGYSLSREERQKAEADVTARAVANYRQRAAEMVRLFDYGSYVIREINVSSDQPPRPYEARMRVQAMAAPAADEALPVEAGKTEVTVNVNGSVQLLK